MEQADPIFLFIGLPAIPLGLIIGKLLRWEEAVLRVWRRVSSKVPFIGAQGTAHWLCLVDTPGLGTSASISNVILTI